MEIISIPFAAVSIISIFIYYLLEHKYRTFFHLFLSLGFVASFSRNLLVYVLIYSLINYFIGFKLQTSKYKKTLFVTGIALNLLQIIVLKYYDFTIGPVFQLFSYTSSISHLSELIVPVGISYFTLQGIGYLINVKMGWEKSEKDFPDFLLYMIFYPKFLSGPVERSNHFLPQIKKGNSFNEQKVAEGLKIALFGFFKKVVIANQLSIVVTSSHTDLELYSGINLWIATLIQPLYLYFDFSGYTDIAIGLAKTFGIDLLPNFNRPFFSQNVTTFWRRFHMSLSFWFNDYIFKQLSFRFRKWGIYASVFAVFVTFSLFGIWHGAGWNFMILGVLQAFALNYEFFTKRQRSEIFSKMPEFLRVWSGRLFTYIFFSLSLIFVFSPDLESSLNYFIGLTDLNSGFDLRAFSLRSLPALCFLSLFLLFEYFEQDKDKIYNKIVKFWNYHSFFRISIYYIMVILIISQLGEKLTFVYQAF
jgi:alginate O-acetyltransferase complex protein AlgI